MNNRLYGAIFVFALFGTGCSVITPPIEKPVIEDHANNWLGMKKLSTFATVPERRMVITKMPDNKFCAEPPPDVAASLTSSLSLLAEGSGKSEQKGATVSAEAKLNFAKELATSISKLFTRSQGVQLFRDGLYNLCQAQLNGTVDSAAYNQHFTDLLNTSKELINKEVENYIPAQKAEDSAANSATSAGEAKDAAIKAKSAEEKASEFADTAKKAADAIKEAKEKPN